MIKGQIRQAGVMLTTLDIVGMVSSLSRRWGEKATTRVACPVWSGRKGEEGMTA